MGLHFLTMRTDSQLAGPLLLLACTGLVCAEDVTVTARVALVNGADGERAIARSGNVVLWLTPASEDAGFSGCRSNAAGAAGSAQQEFRASC